MTSGVVASLGGTQRGDCGKLICPLFLRAKLTIRACGLVAANYMSENSASGDSGALNTPG